MIFRTSGGSWALRADLEALREQRRGLAEPRIGIVADCAKRFARFHCVADLLFEHQADGGIDLVLHFFAAAAEHHAGDANLLAMN